MALSTLMCGLMRSLNQETLSESQTTVECSLTQRTSTLSKKMNKSICITCLRHQPLLSQNTNGRQGNLLMQQVSGKSICSLRRTDQCVPFAKHSSALAGIKTCRFPFAASAFTWRNILLTRLLSS